VADSLQWERTDTVLDNYQANKFVLDPNEGFGRNQRSQPIKPKEDREAEDAQTFSDDDGKAAQSAQGMYTVCKLLGMHMNV
jgi:hypothetical protein